MSRSSLIRRQVSARIRDDLLNRAKEFNIMLEDVSIVSDASVVSWLSHQLIGHRRT
jgi:hypothetical protein